MFRYSKPLLGGVPGQEVYTPHDPSTDRAFPMSITVSPERFELALTLCLQGALPVELRKFGPASFVWRVVVLSLAGVCVPRRIPWWVVVFCGTGLNKRSPDHDGRGLGCTRKIRHLSVGTSYCIRFCCVVETVGGRLECVGLAVAMG